MNDCPHWCTPFSGIRTGNVRTAYLARLLFCCVSHAEWLQHINGKVCGFCSFWTFSRLFVSFVFIRSSSLVISSVCRNFSFIWQASPALQVHSARKHILEKSEGMSTYCIKQTHVFSPLSVFTTLYPFCFLLKCYVRLDYKVFLHPNTEDRSSKFQTHWFRSAHITYSILFHYFSLFSLVESDCLHWQQSTDVCNGHCPLVSKALSI